jgi:hypothetical protein
VIIAGSERFHASHLLSADAGVVALQERRRHQAMSCGPRTGFAEMLNQETGDVRFCQVLVIMIGDVRFCQVLVPETPRYRRSGAAAPVRAGGALMVSLGRCEWAGHQP